MDTNQADNITSHKVDSGDTNKGLDLMVPTEEKEEVHQADASLARPSSIRSNHFISFSPNFLASTPLPSNSPREPLSLMCNVAGASSSAQNANPGNTPPQKELAQEEDPQSFSTVAKAANIVLDITEEMVPTPYKKMIRQVYLKKLKESFHSQKFTAGIEQDETLKDMPKGNLNKGIISGLSYWVGRHYHHL